MTCVTFQYAGMPMVNLERFVIVIGMSAAVANCARLGGLGYWPRLAKGTVVISGMTVVAPLPLIGDVPAMNGSSAPALAIVTEITLLPAAAIDLRTPGVVGRWHWATIVLEFCVGMTRSTVQKHISVLLVYVTKTIAFVVVADFADRTGAADRRAEDDVHWRTLIPMALQTAQPLVDVLFVDTLYAGIHAPFVTNRADLTIPGTDLGSKIGDEPMAYDTVGIFRVTLMDVLGVVRARLTSMTDDASVSTRRDVGIAGLGDGRIVALVALLSPCAERSQECAREIDSMA